MAGGSATTPTRRLNLPEHAENRGTAKRVFRTAAGLTLFALGVAAAVGLAYLTGLTIRFFAVEQTISAALTVAAHVAAMGAIWTCIPSGWHRLRPGI
ncbi:hypothetical protein [Arthrobacter sp. NPDC057013]|uniref:hypothetical protein n=1 Tax=Arthrobacter sp. NPDC057013 TaxID=3345999 RepID=UPI00363A2760